MVLHVGASVEGLHADTAGEPLGVEALLGGAQRAGRTRGLTAQLYPGTVHRLGSGTGGINPELTSQWMTVNHISD